MPPDLLLLILSEEHYASALYAEFAAYFQKVLITYSKRLAPAEASQAMKKYANIFTGK